VFLGETAVLGGNGGRDTVKAGGGHGFDLLLQRPFFSGRRVTDEGPEVGDVGDLHGIFDFGFSISKFRRRERGAQIFGQLKIANRESRILLSRGDL